MADISIHVLREEDDFQVGAGGFKFKLFQSTSSARRTTRRDYLLRRQPPYFNPRPPRGGRLRFCQGLLRTSAISIHVLREEDDPAPLLLWTCPPLFQSTSSARRTTAHRRHLHPAGLDFNPRPPRGGRPDLDDVGVPHIFISIHVLREEDDFRLF